MAKLEIVLHPHKALYTKALPVQNFDEELHTFIDNMVETMYEANGIGLAANQVNTLKRVVVIDTGTKEEPKLIEFVNPVITSAKGSITWDEGCLSFPEAYQKVKRAREVTVTFQDRFGQEHALAAQDLLAVAIQHEVDHIDGICFIDRMGPTKRKLTLKEFYRVQEERKLEAAEKAAAEKTAAEKSSTVETKAP